MPHPEAGRIPKAPHTFTDSKSTYTLSVFGQKPSHTVFEILFIDSKTTYPPFVLAAASAYATVESGLGFRHAPRLSTCTPAFSTFVVSRLRVGGNFLISPLISVNCFKI